MHVGIQSRKRFKQFDKEGTEDLNEWRERFVACMDPTEYAGAVELLGSWENWELFKRSWPHFQENVLPKWMEEIDIKIRSDAVRQVVLDAATESKSANSSAKWIAEGKYKPATSKRGRPSNAEVEHELKIAAGIDKEIEDDLDRLSSVVSFDK